MQFRSIVSLFIVTCLIIVALFGNVVESEKVLSHANQYGNYRNKNNVFGQRLRRRARYAQRRFKRDDNDVNQPDGGASSNGFGSGGADPSASDGNQAPSYGQGGSGNDFSNASPGGQPDSPMSSGSGNPGPSDGN